MTPSLQNGLFQELRQLTVGTIEANEPMAKHTYFRTGGLVRAFIAPKTTENFVEVHQWLCTNDIPFEIVGAGSNILWSDEPFAGAVLCTHPALTELTIEGDMVQAGAGVRMSRFLTEVQGKQLGGFSFLYGIPGTIGGGVRMNAGTRIGCMKDVLVDVQVMKSDGSTETRSAEALDLNYRRSNLSEDEIVLSARMKSTGPLTEDELKDLKASKEYRKNTQPLQYPSGGSVFRNPEGDADGRLIEAAGLKGRSIGGAQISELHANFIIADGEAMSSDVLRLIREAQAEVYRVHDVWLEPEVQLMGPWPHEGDV